MASADKAPLRRGLCFFKGSHPYWLAARGMVRQGTLCQGMAWRSRDARRLIGGAADAKPLSPQGLVSAPQEP